MCVCVINKHIYNFLNIFIANTIQYKIYMTVYAKTSLVRPWGLEILLMKLFFSKKIQNNNSIKIFPWNSTNNDFMLFAISGSNKQEAIYSKLINWKPQLFQKLYLWNVMEISFETSRLVILHEIIIIVFGISSKHSKWWMWSYLVRFSIFLPMNLIIIVAHELFLLEQNYGL